MMILQLFKRPEWPKLRPTQLKMCALGLKARSVPVYVLEKIQNYVKFFLFFLDIHAQDDCT